jgi:glucosamine--fructose-6-phosphate aminotransferase (isomerizing)
MCGIVGYVGKHSGIKPVIEGLKTLEYRGYDSAGLSVLSDGQACTVKQVGMVEALERKVAKEITVQAHTAIGHTRWATHGAPTILNAHPHHSADNTVLVVHNGIIENYKELKEQLQADGYEFVSETDTEVIPHLIDSYRKQGKAPLQAFTAAIKDLQGAYAICALFADKPDSVFIARLSSPLVVGVGEGEHYVASDAVAVMDHTKKVLYLEDYEVAEVTPGSVKIHDIKKEIAVQRRAEELDYEVEKTSLGGFPHFMIKEIFEAPQTILTATRGRVKPDGTLMLGGLTTVKQQLQYIDRVVIVACGTSYYAGLVGEYLIEEIAGIPVETQLASEFKYRSEPFSRSTALIAISQSGETADTIAALKKVEGYGVLRLGVVNAVGSTIARMTDAGVYCHAGPEQSVASTKAFIAQVTVLSEIALHLSRGQTPLYKPLMKELLALPKKAKQLLEQHNDIRKMAKKYAGYKDFLYIGRQYAYPCALEGALKLKEISYIHAEGYAGGELKHGPLALIDENMPSLAIACHSSTFDKTLSNIQEIKARGGPVLAIGTEGDKHLEALADDVIYIPATLEQSQPLLVAIVLQLLAYYVAIEKGYNVDRPRNLAKSVTVE